MIGLSNRMIPLSSRKAEAQGFFSVEVEKGVLEAWRVWRGNRVC